MSTPSPATKSARTKFVTHARTVADELSTSGESASTAVGQLMDDVLDSVEPDLTHYPDTDSLRRVVIATLEAAADAADHAAKRLVTRNRR